MLVFFWFSFTLIEYCSLNKINVEFCEDCKTTWSRRSTNILWQGVFRILVDIYLYKKDEFQISIQMFEKYT